MYKALIADDENKICQLIQAMGNWDELGIEIVDICHSGDDAWESIQKKEPDIALLDIRMPVYDGLQIINKVNEKYGMSRNICFIIISGYAEFEYARQAIQYNIVNYLLKPLDRKQLNDTLQKACNSLSRKQQQAENAILLQKNRRSLQAACITAVQAGRVQEGITVKELNEQYCMSFDQGCFLGGFLNFPFSISEHENLFIEKFQEKIQKYFACCLEVAVKTEGTGIYLILNYPADSHQILMNKIQEFYKSIGRMAKTYGEFQMYMGVGSSTTEPGRIRYSLREAEIAELSHLLYGEKHLLFYERLPGETAGLHQFIPVKKFRELEQLLEKLQPFEIKKWFSDISESIEKSRGRLKNGQILMELGKSIGDCLIQVFAEMDSALVDKGLSELQLSLKQASDLSNYLWILKTKTVLLVEQMAEAVSQRESYPIYAAKQYIQQNFSRQINLAEVAERLHFSSAYFGNIFKRNVGKTFNAYLTEVRMENAKKLLKQPGYTIARVAEMVGYQDVKYFSKTFKSLYGVKPTEYKKLLSSMHAHNLHI